MSYCYVLLRTTTYYALLRTTTYYYVLLRTTTTTATTATTATTTATTTTTTTTSHPPPPYQPPGASTHRHRHHQRKLYLQKMQGLRPPICDSCISSRGSFASTVTTGEVAEAQAPKLRQQLELQIRRGRNCQTTGGRIVRKHCKYRGTRRCCQEGLNTPKT